MKGRENSCLNKKGVGVSDLYEQCVRQGQPTDWKWQAAPMFIPIQKKYYSAAVKRLKAKTTIPPTTTCMISSQIPMPAGTLGIIANG